MQVTETQNAGLRREYRVVVGQAELDKELNAKLADMSRRANIRGFRPGKVPVSHLKRIYGRSAMAEVLQDAVDQHSKRLLEEKNLKPAYQPDVKLPTDEAEIAAVMDGKGDLAFTMALEVIPDFELKDHSGLSLTRHVVEVAESDIDETLARLAARSTSFEAKQDEAGTGDRVTINFVGTIDGKGFEGGTAEDVALEIGSGQFIPGFEDQLIGARAGDEVTVKVSFPADYGVAELAGKPAEFATRVTKVESARQTVIDEDFARKMGIGDLAKLRATIKDSMGGEFAQMSAMKLKRDVLDALDREYAFDLPERLVEAEFNSIWNALQGEMTRSGKSFADEGSTEEQARREYRAIAERRVRLGLVLGRMGERQGVVVSEQELQDALMKRMRQFPGQEKMVIDHYRRNPGAIVELRGPIFEQKVVDALVAAATVEEKTVSKNELQKMVEDEDEIASA